MITHDVLDWIDGRWIADITEQLVRVPCVTLEEQEVCRLYEQQLRELGLTVDMREVSPQRPNLYARIRGSGRGPTLISKMCPSVVSNRRQRCTRLPRWSTAESSRPEGERADGH